MKLTFHQGLIKSIAA